jgi:molybdopterin molybdotransferase
MLHKAISEAKTDVIYLAEPIFGKSGMITTLTRAHGYIIIDLNREGINKDEPVLVHLL